MKLAIVDPPYPPFIGSGGRKNRASRWYGSGQRSKKDRPSDYHPEAHEWDDPARHRALLLELLDRFDCFAIATSVDGLQVYSPLPVGTRVMAWVKPNAIPGSHRLRSMWEPVIVYPAPGRRSNRGGVGMVPDVYTAPYPRGFIGRKPEGWTHWVLDALTFDPDVDHITDMFAGSGAVTEAINSYRPSWKEASGIMPQVTAISLDSENAGPVPPDPATEAPPAENSPAQRNINATPDAAPIAEPREVADKQAAKRQAGAA